MVERNPTRAVMVRDLQIGGGARISYQSMCATRTQDIQATVDQTNALHEAGADLVRIAIDNKKDLDALKEVRAQTEARLVVDLQENYPLAEEVAPYVDKIRYNPGHLHHLEKEKPIEDKVRWIVGVAEKNDLALRVGVNCGSVAPDFLEKYPDDSMEALVASAVWHCEILDGLGFTRYVVSLKDSDPQKVIEANKRFAEERPDVPLHLGVTEAGMPPEGVIKTRIAYEQLLTKGIGDTLRVSLTVPNNRKHEEIEAARQIVEDIEAGRFRSVPEFFGKGLNIISCPSCSRVENEAFIDLAEDVREMTAYAKEHNLTIAVMGCRVNGPGETDDADLGLWCGPTHVNLKKGEESIGSYPYNEIIPKLREELDALIEAKV
ncbi:MAG: (E)-4-hydroxy-3-methylbut-2-enyl-diphosphate synthase [Candidatus Omnitrophica bacterium]|nr:(E)-4-hydroxy-3-methylbut-2-enyl-diphosphate synthase [Candidatus Omnitrophota bacterium]MCA9446016.1 (E)-4-hydroxy-3-methylbut-2-enyl-diphosphate synthase [Candidatus Omnitrophota bacterium]MCB9784101.1 (E)-4-hydroxy-3-methylbut-2-enyl-diphosphate synthase [Candidatus Omnitrophota bacterium]